ncbi:MAG: hypothetical protein Q9226_001270 [Calogaya cf. arnoldii]
MQLGEQTVSIPAGASAMFMGSRRPLAPTPKTSEASKDNVKIQIAKPEAEKTGMLMDTLLGGVDKDRWENSKLDRLPVEIRNQIYRYVLGQNQHIFIRSPPTPKAFTVLTRSPTEFLFGEHRAALLRTCRHICAETVDLLYQINTFIFSSQSDFKVFADMVNPQQLDQIRHIGIQLSSPISHQQRQRLEHQEWDHLLSAVISIRHLRIVTFDIGHWITYTSKSYLYLRKSLAPLLNLEKLQESGLDLRVQIVRAPAIHHTEFLELIEKMKQWPGESRRALLSRGPQLLLGAELPRTSFEA